jgi:hypothetical protein
LPPFDCTVADCLDPGVPALALDWRCLPHSARVSLAHFFGAVAVRVAPRCETSTALESSEVLPAERNTRPAPRLAETRPLEIHRTGRRSNACDVMRGTVRAGTAWAGIARAAAAAAAYERCRN